MSHVWCFCILRCGCGVFGHREDLKSLKVLCNLKRWQRMTEVLAIPDFWLQVKELQGPVHASFESSSRVLGPHLCPVSRYLIFFGTVQVASRRSLTQMHLKNVCMLKLFHRFFTCFERLSRFDSGRSSKPRSVLGVSGRTTGHGRDSETVLETPWHMEAEQLKEMAKVLGIGFARNGGGVGKLASKTFWISLLWFSRRILRLWFSCEALEGVQKDVRRTVSVMQYNILASCDAVFVPVGFCSDFSVGCIFCFRFSVTLEVFGEEHTALVPLAENFQSMLLSRSKKGSAECLGSWPLPVCRLPGYRLLREHRWWLYRCSSDAGHGQVKAQSHGGYLVKNVWVHRLFEF